MIDLWRWERLYPVPLNHQTNIGPSDVPDHRTIAGWDEDERELTPDEWADAHPTGPVEG